jgi:hypothetical protein
MLQINPSKRISVSDALKHEFFEDMSYDIEYQIKEGGKLIEE